MERVTRFHFVDRGQDCLWWDVADRGDGIGEVVDANLQGGVWANGNTYVNLQEPHAKGDRLVFTDDLARSFSTGYFLTFCYPITRVEDVALAGAA